MIAPKNASFALFQSIRAMNDNFWSWGVISLNIDNHSRFPTNFLRR